MSRYIYKILLTLQICVLTSCTHKEEPFSASDTPMIEFSIMNEFAVESKGIIDDTNYQQFGFIAFGACSLESWENDDLFGANGTEVKYTSQAGWNYSPMCYWQKGSYDFAGVMPSSLFNATHNHTITTQPGTYTASLTETENGSQLTLNFGTNGFDLAETQTDLMVAFDSQTVHSASSANLVEFAFDHQLAMLNIEVLTNGPMKIEINSIKIYGNPKIATSATFTAGNNAITSEWTLGPVTTAESYFHLVNNGSKIESLLVFPKQRNSTDENLTVAVEYTESYGTSNFSKTKYGEININWRAGKIYTYKTNLTSESIVFGAPTVTDWSDGGAADSIPQM